MRKTTLRILVLLFFLGTFPAFAQDVDERLRINLRRNFGYSAGGRIQGRFTIFAEGPQDLIRVEYLLDGEILAEVSDFPYKFTFSTGEYSLGVHTLSAVGIKADDSEISSQEITVEFLSADESWRRAGKIAIPLFAGVVVLMGLGALLPALLSRRAGSFKLGTYGSAGGAVCRRCGFPYPRHFLSPNLMLGKLERCPHCGKWGITPRASRAALEDAEERYRADAEKGLLEQDSEVSESQEQRKLDETRFMDF